ncbi:MAG: hypothetical protein ACP5GU_04895 [Thermoprotei archaeon]|jgi:hypothetical protein
MSNIDELISEGKSFEVSYSNGNPIIQNYKGISKTSVSKEELRGFKKVKSKISSKIIPAIKDICNTLINNKIPFKIVFIKKDVEVRFDLDHYVHIYDNGSISIAGFSSNKDHPLSLIYDTLESIGEIKFLKPLR